VTVTPDSGKDGGIRISLPEGLLRVVPFVYAEGLHPEDEEAVRQGDPSVPERLVACGSGGPAETWRFMGNVVGLASVLDGNMPRPVWFTTFDEL
jgi:hypothetical protein